jgi:hypothetical protein
MVMPLTNATDPAEANPERASLAIIVTAQALLSATVVC